MATSVPVIDVNRDPAAVGAELDGVCREVGFFQIVGHGVSNEVIKQAWETASAFFDLPLDDRMSVHRPYAGYPYGYVPVNGEVLSRSLGTESAPDLKEIYNVGPIHGLPREPIDDGEAMMFAANLWPKSMPELKVHLSAYFEEMLALGERLTRLFAVSLDLPAHFFASTIDRTPSSMRTINYPEQPTPPTPGQLRAGAHTDYGTFTILCQDDAPGGLEVKNPWGDSWIPIPSVPDAFVINIGDMLARWTNDRWRSTVHRVVNPPIEHRAQSRRQSIAFFHNANYDCRVECIPTCATAENPPRYEPVLAGPHLMSKFLKTVEA